LTDKLVGCTPIVSETVVIVKSLYTDGFIRHNQTQQITMQPIKMTDCSMLIQYTDVHLAFHVTIHHE